MKRIVLVTVAATLLLSATIASAGNDVFIVSRNVLYGNSSDQAINFTSVFSEDITNDILIDNNSIFLTTAYKLYSLNKTNGYINFMDSIIGTTSIKQSDNYIYATTYSVLYRVNKTSGAIEQQKNYNQVLNAIYTFFGVQTGTGNFSETDPVWSSDKTGIQAGIQIANDTANMAIDIVTNNSANASFMTCGDTCHNSHFVNYSVFDDFRSNLTFADINANNVTAHNITADNLFVTNVQVNNITMNLTNNPMGWVNNSTMDKNLSNYSNTPGFLTNATINNDGGFDFILTTFTSGFKGTISAKYSGNITYIEVSPHNEVGSMNLSVGSNYINFTSSGYVNDAALSGWNKTVAKLQKFNITLLSASGFTNPVTVSIGITKD